MATRTAETRNFRKAATEIAWTLMIRESPDFGAQLRKLAAQ
jgi:hypothetical protein